MLNTYVITTTKMKLFYSSKAVSPQGGTLMYTLFVLIYDLLNISLKSITLLTSTRGDQKVRGKVLLNRITFIDCNENS